MKSDSKIREDGKRQMESAALHMRALAEMAEQLRLAKEESHVERALSDALADALRDLTARSCEDDAFDAGAAATLSRYDNARKEG